METVLNKSIDFSSFEDKLIRVPDENQDFSCYNTNLKEGFCSVKMNNLTLKNKFCFSCYGDDIFFDADYNLKDDFFDYYREIAKSNVGLIITGGFTVNLDNESDMYDNLKMIEKMKNFINEIHLFGTKIFLKVKSCLGRANSQNKFLNLFNYSASFNKCYNDAKLSCVRASDGICTKIIDKMSKITNFANICGFDGILIDGDLFGFVGEISSPELNKRVFGYYSEINDFTKNLLNMLIKNNKELNIFYSFSFESYISNVYEGEYKKIISSKNFNFSFKRKILINFLVKLVSYGVDGFLFNMGTYETEFLSSSSEFQSENVFSKVYEEVCEFLKQKSIKNKFGEDVYFVYKNIGCDFNQKFLKDRNYLISITNQILADKNFLFKINSNIPFKNCIKCGICSGYDNRLNKTSCVLNPNFGNLAHCDDLKEVAVVGSGISGLNCAIFLAKRGFKVDLYERLNTLNQFGKLREIFNYNIDLKKYNEFLDNEIYFYEKLGKINLKLNCNFSVNDEKLSKYSSIVIATGSLEKFSTIPGAILKNVKNIYDVLANKKFIEDNQNFVIDAKSELSFALAQYLLLKEKNVTILISSLEFLWKMQNSNLTYYMYSLKKLKCKIFLQSKIKRIEEDFLEVLINSKLDNDEFSSIILNMKSGKNYKYLAKAKNIDLDLFIYEPDSYSNNTLFYKLVNSNYNGSLFMIGNALYPCDLAECVKTAYYVAKNI